MIDLDLARPPQAWAAEQAAADRRWIHPLSDDAIADFDAALAHAIALGKPLLSMSADDFPLRGAGRLALQQAVAATQHGFGFVLLRGFPVRRWSEADTRLAYWGMGLHMGVARTQNAASEVLNDVRDVGSTAYQVKGGRGYNTRLALDFHIDFCDVVGLLCRRTAKSGGRSLVVSSLALLDEIEARHPDLLPVLQQPLPMSWQGSQAPGEAPTYLSSLAGRKDGHVAFRTNRKNIVAAQRDYPDAPRWTPGQERVVQLIDDLAADPRLCYSMSLREGDLQLLNNYVVIHSRTDFEDFEAPDEKRHLLRLWLNLPQAQPLPDDWLDAFKDVRAGAVRGGVRGQRVDAAYIAYERRQAQALGMANAFSDRYPATA